MRKWMRDRLKRKNPETGKGEPAPARLHPAYFDAAPEAAEPAELNQGKTEIPAEREGNRAPEEVTEVPSARSPQPQREGGGTGGDPRRRRRRGRGGRGRGGSRT